MYEYFHTSHFDIITIPISIIYHMETVLFNFYFEDFCI